MNKVHFDFDTLNFKIDDIVDFLNGYKEINRIIDCGMLYTKETDANGNPVKFGVYIEPENPILRIEFIDNKNAGPFDGVTISRKVNEFFSGDDLKELLSFRLNDAICELASDVYRDLLSPELSISYIGRDKSKKYVAVKATKFLEDFFNDRCRLHDDELALADSVLLNGKNILPKLRNNTTVENFADIVGKELTKNHSMIIITDFPLSRTQELYNFNFPLSLYTATLYGISDNMPVKKAFVNGSQIKMEESLPFRKVKTKAQQLLSREGSKTI